MKTYIKSLIIIVAIVLSSSLCFSYGKYGNIERNDEIIQRIQDGGQEYISKQTTQTNSNKPLSIIWVQKDYLTKQQALDLQQKIDKAIVEIRNTLEIPKNERNFTIHYYVYGAHEASHAITGYHMLDKAHPTTFITWYAQGRSPYVHETVHIIAWHWRSVWIKEGLAVYLNQKLGGEPTFPNFGKNLNFLAKKHIESISSNGNLSSILADKYKVGENGLVFFKGPKEERIHKKKIFYILSGSFTEYLFTQLGANKFMQIYNANNTKEAINKVTGKAISQWENSWANYLRNTNFTEYEKEN
ncbi:MULTISPECIES: hypothetical protein [unclassified Francisella]|uniref:hypothetical protein n=1 Tax=unclassified Francisella TaxID=2610885 RepID=UPI002E34372F|nr:MULTISPECIES: hypothetical protein [unclassified Francisella]MED7819087.1 hypothetical protein [Francisella sp. 19S2-4]MED7829953.1 hypothetical protein [Francisella sp. 19S2-10]